MSVEAMAWAFKQRFEGDATLKLILLALCDHADEEWRCWPSQERLAAKAECSIDTVQRKLRQLEKWGILAKRRRPNKTAIYQIYQEKNARKPQSLRFQDIVDFEPENNISHNMRKPQHVRFPEAAQLCGPNHQVEPSVEVEDSRARTARAEDLFEAEPVDEPPKAKLFRKGKTALVSLGLSEERSGSVIGQWLKQRHDPLGILAAIEYAREQCAVSPVAYVTQILKGNGNGKASFDDQIRELADQARDLERTAGAGRPPDGF